MGDAHFHENIRNRVVAACLIEALYLVFGVQANTEDPPAAKLLFQPGQDTAAQPQAPELR